MNEDVKKNIRVMLEDNSKFSKILSAIQHKYEHDPNNFILEAQDIFNYVFKLRAQRLGNKTSIQALHVDLVNDFDWFVKMQLNEISRKVEYLFFCNKTSKKMLLHNEETLILNCIYKINLYFMPLAIGTRVTNLNIFFYAAMCFMKKEKLKNYCFLIKAYKELYQELNIPLSKMWLSNEEINISAAIAKEIEDSIVHLLCC